MRRSTPSRRSRAASGRGCSPSPTRCRRALGRLPPVDRDLDELVDGCCELLLPGALQALAQDRHDLAPWPAVDEDDEAEAALRLVLGVQRCELREDPGVVVAALLCRGARGGRLAADRRMGVEELLLLVG